MTGEEKRRGELEGQMMGSELEGRIPRGWREEGTVGGVHELSGE